MLIVMWTNAHSNGQVEQLIRLVDGDGQVCGLGNNSAYPFAYYMVRVNLTFQYLSFDYTVTSRVDPVCVSRCPIMQDHNLTCQGTSHVNKSECLTPFTPITFGDKRGYVKYNTNSILVIEYQIWFAVKIRKAPFYTISNFTRA